MYISTVFCTVYELRQNGRRLTPDEVRARGAQTGFLVFGPTPVIPETHAQLFADETMRVQLLRELRYVEVKRIKGGVMLRGLWVEPVTYASQPQSWWCVPILHNPIDVQSLPSHQGP